jgi:formiminotetrahydrofolate cyclodeaminase
MDDIFHDQSINTFLDTLASSSPTPGGGSVAALSGAMAAGLISMVCAITLNKKKKPDEAELDEIRNIHAQAETLRHELQKLAQEDIEIFGHLSAAYKLPRTTDADAASRHAAIQKITHQATDIPLAVAHKGAALLPLCTAIVNRCSRLLVSDIGVAAELARSTVQTALLNVEINLTSLEDVLFVRQVRSQMEDLTGGLEGDVTTIVETVRSRLNS